MEKLIYGIGIAIGLVLLGWYLTHIWSDCLEENSIFTCMRMLSK